MAPVTSALRRLSAAARSKHTLKQSEGGGVWGGGGRGDSVGCVLGEEGDVTVGQIEGDLPSWKASLREGTVAVKSYYECC